MRRSDRTRPFGDLPCGMPAPCRTVRRGYRTRGPGDLPGAVRRIRAVRGCRGLHRMSRIVAVHAEDVRQFVEEQRDREAGHQSGHHRVRHEPRDAAEAQHAEGDLEQPGQREAQRGEEQDLLDAAARQAAQFGVPCQARDERGEDEHRRCARNLVGQQRAAQNGRRQQAVDRRGEHRPRARFRGDRPERAVGDEAQRQHLREQHERRRDPARDLAHPFHRAMRRRFGRRMFGHRSILVARAAPLRCVARAGRAATLRGRYLNSRAGFAAEDRTNSNGTRTPPRAARHSGDGAGQAMPRGVLLDSPDRARHPSHRRPRLARRIAHPLHS